MYETDNMNIKIIAQVDRVHDFVHAAYDSGYQSPRAHYFRILNAVTEVRGLLTLLNQQIEYHNGKFKFETKRTDKTKVG